MDGLTRSSSSRGRNDAARGSVVLALLGLALPVVAFVAARTAAGRDDRPGDRRNLRLGACSAAPRSCWPGAACGTSSARSGALGGEGAARVGRLLGVIALCIGLSAGIALAVYAVLNVIG